MQRTKWTLVIAPAVSLLVLGAALVGCTIDHHKQGDGDNVKIATPFGGVSIKTDDSAVEVATGLPAYPGAQIVKQHDKDNHDNGAADINMSFGSFQFRVKAVGYRTPDSPDKVLAFYRKGLARFGTVIQCSNHQPVGMPPRTPDGLDCSDDSHNNKAKLKMSDDLSDKTELKAGSKQHQHLVTIDAEGTGTRFDLVALDLPGHFSFGEKDTDDGSRQKE